MDIKKEHLRIKAAGMINTLERMSQKEREVSPSGHFARDYNALRELVLRLEPSLQPVMPPDVPFDEDFNDLPLANYAEIEAYCRQIREFLDT